MTVLGRRLHGIVPQMVQFVPFQLPVKWGGLGIRCIKSLASLAYLSSSISVRLLIDKLLRSDFGQPLVALFEEVLSRWKQLREISTPPIPFDCRQSSWDNKICSWILAGSSDMDRARLLACKTFPSGAWMQALPSANISLRLGNEETRLAVGLRLGAPLVLAHECVCGSTVSATGHHGLS